VSRYLLSVDLGTTGCKAALYTSDGRLLGSDYLEYGLSQPAPGWVEQDAEQWWALTCAAIQRALAASAVDGREVAALSISSQGISFVPVAESGAPLASAINWLDARASAEAAQIAARFSLPDLFHLTGKRPSAAYVLPKLLWLREHRPEVYRRAHKFLTAHDFLLHRFSGQFFTDHSLAGGTLLYDVNRLSWSAALLSAFDIRESQLPAIRWAGAAVGAIRPEVAHRLGLNPDLLIVVGGQDQKCAALGVQLRPGSAAVSLGTATAVSALSPRPVFDPHQRIPLFPFVAPGLWDLEGVIGTTGAALKWLRQTFFPALDYPALDALATGSPPGARGLRFYPHLAGATSPHWRGEARGAFHGLSLSNTPGDLVRALLEGVAYEIRANLEVIEGNVGALDSLILFGGGAKSALWRQIIAAVTGKAVRLTATVEAANWGACILAGVGCGLFGDRFSMPSGIAQPVTYEPAPDLRERYQALYHLYQQSEASPARI
jgi:xylulokinase